jgi:hypothetical protein
VQIAEQTKTVELPASVRVVVEALSSSVVLGNALVSLTSVNVSLLMKIISPFHEVYKVSPGGNSEMSSSL